jgi:hypothetical protein
MRHFVIKLSDGFYYKSGHAVGQGFHLANIYPEENMLDMLREMIFVKENIDDKVQLTEIKILEISMMENQHESSILS